MGESVTSPGGGVSQETLDAALITTLDNAIIYTDGEIEVVNEIRIPNAITDWASTAPELLNTMQELAAALNNDENFASSIMTLLSGKQALVEKDQPNGYVGLPANSIIPTGALGSGTPDANNFLRGDGTWAGVTVGVRVEEEGTSVLSAATVLNFVGSAVTAVDAGSGEATVTIVGGVDLAAVIAQDITTDNIALGAGALAGAGAKSNNIAIGIEAIASATTGSDNVALGYRAGYAPNNDSANATTTGSRNIFIGMQTGQTSSTQRSDCVAIGYRALIGGNNGGVAIGCDTRALSQDVSIGYEAGMSLQVGGNQNVFVGYRAGKGVTTGINNTLIGNRAGYAAYTITSGSGNSAFGSDAGWVGAGPFSDVTVVGYAALGGGNSATALGKGANAGAAGAVAIGNDSAGTPATTINVNGFRLGTSLHTIEIPGLIQWITAGNEQTTVGAAGAASALPLTPTKYLKVKDSSGATLVIPAYAAS